MINIEFMGAPGAGKSALRDALVERFRRGGVICATAEEALVSALRRCPDIGLWRLLLRLVPRRWLARRVYAVLSRTGAQARAWRRFEAAMPDAWAAAVESHALDTAPPEEKSLGLSRLKATAAAWELIGACSGADEPVIFDEGFLQRSMGIFLSPASEAAPDAAEIARYLDAIPRARIAVLVEAETQTCLERLRSRPRGLPRRLADADDDEMHAFLAAGRELFDALAESIQARGAVVVRVCNDGPPAREAKNLAETISRHIERRPAG